MNTIRKTATLNVELETSEYGTPAPTLRVTLPRNVNHRHCSALLHTLAAELELAIPERECWPVTMSQSSDYRGSIQLELMKGTPEEADRAMAVLKTVAAH